MTSNPNSTANIVIAGVGGQGLVLTTKLICDAALKAGLDVKSNDVIGLSQRGGKVWGSIRIGPEVYSPNVPPKGADYLMALEPLEGLRYKSSLKPSGKIFMNRAVVPPVPVIAEKVSYPSNIEEELSSEFELVSMDANAKAVELGSVKIANTFLVGMLAKCLSIDKEIWHNAISENVPKKFIDMNIEAFDIGYEMV